MWLYVASAWSSWPGSSSYARARSAAAGRPLVSVRLFRNRTSNLGLVTQNVQWLVLQGAFFVISVFLQQERGYSAIETGLALVPATIGILLSSADGPADGQPAPPAAADPGRLHRHRRRHRPAARPRRADSAYWTFWPGLFLMGFGVGVMLTASVNVVQSAWPEDVQGDISGVSRSVSNLGSSLGVAIAGSVIVAATAAGNAPFLTAMGVGGWAPSLGGADPANRRRR